MTTQVMSHVERRLRHHTLRRLPQFSGKGLCQRLARTIRRKWEVTAAYKEVVQHIRPLSKVPIPATLY